MGDWKEEKRKLGMDLPNLPYFLDGENKVTETMAIMRYICNKYKPELLGSTLKERTEIDMFGLVMHDLKLNSLTYPFYKHGDRAKIDAEGKAKLEPIVKWLGSKQFLIGEKVCYLDFILFEICNVMDFVTEGRIWSDFPTLYPYT